MTNWNDRFTGLVMPSSLDTIQKSKYRPIDAERAPRAYTENPLDLRTQLGYKDRRYAATFDVLKRIPGQLGVVAAIVQTRCNQVSTFAVPHRENQGIGFRVTHKEKNKATTKGQLEFIKSAEEFFRNCGHGKYNEHSNVERDNFENFLKKFTRDSLVIDQGCMEIVPDKKGRPYEFMAVDGSSIRIASPFLEDLAGHKRSFSNLIDPSNLQGEDSYTTLDPKAPFMERPAYVQVVDGKVVNVFSRNELGFCIRNPRTDLLVQGYGQSELEMMINIITAHLNAETYNSVFFKQGSSAKGILNMKGDSMSPDQFETFKRMWRESMEGVQNFHRTPILQNEAGVEWINMQTSNRDMEYGAWLDYCVKIGCFVPGTPVLMADGTNRAIDSVSPGDYVFSHAGNRKKVNNLQITEYDGLVYKINAGGRVVTSTPEHPFLAVKLEHVYASGVPSLHISEPQWTKASDIVDNVDYLVVPKKPFAHQNNSSQFLMDRLASAGSVSSQVYESPSFFFVPVTEVSTESYVGKVYNIEVEGDHTYIVDGLAVHNCAVYQIDPAELNFDMQGGTQQTPMFESSSEWKLKASRDKGLRPLLRFVASSINKHILSRMDDDFVFEFVGLDEPSEKEKHDLRKEQSATYLTLNEVRVAEDRPPLPYGNIPLNPVYVQVMSLAKAEEKATKDAAQAQTQAESPMYDTPTPGGEQQEAPPDDTNDHIPAYTDTFGVK